MILNSGMLRKLLLGAVLLTFVGCSATRPPIEGAWRKVTDDEHAAVKVLSDGHFAFGNQSGDGAWSGGGTYTYEEGTYTETVTYHSVPSLVGKTIAFECIIVDGEWLHKAQFESEGRSFQIDEVWRRVDNPALKKEQK